MKVSIVIPVYQRVSSLQIALNSVIAQTYSDWEVIVVDDGSSTEYAKNIASVVSELDHPSARLLRYEENKNGAYARNRGICASKGDLVAFLDSDDVWHPEKLECVVAFFKNCPDSNFVYHQYQNIQAGVEQSPLPKKGISSKQSVAEYSFCENKGGGIQSSCITVQAALARKIQFNEKLRGHQDWDFALRAGHEVGTKIGFIPRPLTRRFIAEGNVGMVSRNLDYHYSAIFLKDYKTYFSLTARAAYSAFVLERKRLVSTPKPRFGWNQILAYTFHFFYCAVLRRSVNLLESRCADINSRLRRHNVKHVALIGYNDYTNFLLARLDRSIETVLLIDRYKRGATPFGNVRSAAELSGDEWDTVALAIAMTDHHYPSMKEDVAKHAPHEIEVIQF